MKVSVEDAIKKRKESKKLTYFRMTHMDYEVMDMYPDMPTEAWIMAFWFYEFYCQPNNKKKIGDWLWVSGKAPISRLYPFHIRDTTTVTKLMRWLCEGNPNESDDRPNFLEKKIVRNPEIACGKQIFYKPLPMLMALCSHDIDLPEMNYNEVDEPEDEEPEPKVVPLSDELFSFYDLLKKSTSTYNHHKPPTNEAPTKMWQNVDKYIHELMEGVFYTNHKDSFDKKAESRGEIPKMSLSNIVEVCSTALNPCGKDAKPSIDAIFLRYKSSNVYTSPFLNYVWASAPRPMPKYTDEQIAELQVKYASAKEKLSQVALDKAKIKSDNPYIYLIMDKVMDLFDEDTRERLGKYNTRTPTKGDIMFFADWCVRAFNKYRNDRKNPKWTTWDDWVRDFKVDDRKMWTPWFWTLHYIRGGGSNGKFILTEDSAIRAKIDDIIAHPFESKYDD